MEGLDSIIEEKLCEDIKIRIDFAEFYARVCGGNMTINYFIIPKKEEIQNIFNKLLNYAKYKNIKSITILNVYNELEETLTKLGFRAMAHDEYFIIYTINIKNTL